MFPHSDVALLPALTFWGLDGYFLAQEQGYFMARAGDRTAWPFEWTAPEAGRGPLTLYVGMLDGDGASDAVIGRTDPFGDDFATLTRRLCEGAGECALRVEEPGEIHSAASCEIKPLGRIDSSSDDSFAAFSRGLLLLLGLLLWSARRRRRQDEGDFG